MKTLIENTIRNIENKHPEDPTITSDLDYIAELLSKNVDDSILIINELNEESIRWISSRFEGLSYKFQNKKFVECLKNLLSKFPNISYLKEDVQEAVEAFYEE